MKAKEIIYACEKYDKHGYFIRDCLMVDVADIVLAVWDGKEWEQMYQHEYLGDNIVAWMPLPKRYEYEGDNNDK